MRDLSVNVGSLVLKNPIVIGGGPISGTVDHIKHCVDAGAGAIVTKTTNRVVYLQRYPRPMYQLLDFNRSLQDPYFVPDRYTWLHREHNSVFPPENFVKIVAAASPYARQHGVPLIGNYTARSVEEWTEIAALYANAGADALELNFCCPFPPDGVAKTKADTEIGIFYTMNPERALEVVRAIKKVVSIPTFAKISPDGANFVRMARLMKEAGADGVTMFANNKFLRIDIESGLPVLYGPSPATGAGVMGDTMRWVSEVAQGCDIPIMSGRGANNWRDAVEFLMAGASAVQFVQAVMVRGLGHIKEMTDGLEAYMGRRGYKSVADFQGVALKRIYSNLDMVEKVKARMAVFDLKKCVGCRRCVDVCWYDAIGFARKALPHKANCSGCGLCAQVCPANVITMADRDNDLDHFRALASAHRDLAPADITW